MTFLSTLASCFLGREGRRVFMQPLKHLESKRDLRGGLPVFGATWRWVYCQMQQL